MPAMFTCERMNTRLTVKGCARMFIAAQDPANKPKPWESRSACMTCLTGARNAGRAISPVAEQVQALSKVCPRCLRPTDRLIHKRLCVSCYNRQGEVVKGRNAKGGSPRHLLEKLRYVDVAVTVAGQDVEVRHAPGVVGAAEIIVHLSKRAETPMAFGWASFGPGNL